MNSNPIAWMIDTLDGKHLMLYGSNPPPVFDSEVNAIPLYTRPVKALTNEDRVKVIGTLKWAEDLLREAGHDEAVDEVQDCIMLLRKAQENG